MLQGKKPMEREYCTWPFKIGVPIRSKYWDNTDIDLTITVVGLNHTTVKYIRSAEPGFIHETTLTGFGDIGDWYYTSPKEKRKSGFGQFVKDKQL